MARFRRIRAAYGGVRKRMRGFRTSRAGKILGASSGFVLGVGVGMTDLDKKIPVELKVLLACLPSGVVKGIPMGYQIQNFMKGCLIGDIIQARTGINLMPDGMAAGKTSSTASY